MVNMRDRRLRDRDPLLTATLHAIGHGSTVEMAHSVIAALPNLATLADIGGDDTLRAQRDAARQLAREAAATTTGDTVLQLNAQITACLQAAQGNSPEHRPGTYAWTPAWDAINRLRDQRDQYAAAAANRPKDTPPTTTRVGGTGEIARMLGIRATEARSHTKQAGFPKPLGTVGNGDAWDLAAVQTWWDQRTKK